MQEGVDTLSAVRRQQKVYIERELDYIPRSVRPSAWEHVAESGLHAVAYTQRDVVWKLIVEACAIEVSV